jgi:hypothetical protein
MEKEQFLKMPDGISDINIYTNINKLNLTFTYLIKQCQELVNTSYFCQKLADDRLQIIKNLEKSLAERNKTIKELEDNILQK